MSLDKEWHPSDKDFSLNFDAVEEVIIPVTYKGKKYALKEASGDTVALYRNAAVARMGKLSDGGKPTSLTKVGDLEPFLVALCFHEVDQETGELGHHVNEKVIRAMPHQMVRKLFDTVKKISGLVEEDDSREIIVNALLQEDAPVDLLVLREWLSTKAELSPEDRKKVTKFFRATSEERAGN